jgi:hypothetical protein
VINPPRAAVENDRMLWNREGYFVSAEGFVDVVLQVALSQLGFGAPCEKDPQHLGLTTTRR